MNVFQELERLTQNGITVAIMLKAPDIEGDEIDDKNLMNQVVIGPSKNLNENYEDNKELLVLCKAQEGESIQNLVYRAILEFDEKFPEYL